MRFVLASLLLLATVPSDSYAQIFRARAARAAVCNNVSACAVQVQEVVHVQQLAVVQQVYVPIYVAQAVFVDPRISYHYVGGAYYPPQQTVAAAPSQSTIQPKATATAPRSEMDAMNTRMDKIEQTLQKLLERSQEPTTPPAQPPRVPGFEKVSYAPPTRAGRTYVDVLTNNCAECHSARTKGNNLVMFPTPGQLAAGLNYDEVWKAIAEDRMPPRSHPRVTEGDKQILRAAFGINES